jgi:Ca-activated chloride channel family protein
MVDLPPEADGLTQFSSGRIRFFGLTALVVACVAALLVALSSEPSGAMLPMSLWGRELSLTDPRSLWALLLVPFLLFGVGYSYADLPWQQRLLSLLLRGAFFCALIFGISRPVETEQSSSICTVLLVDVSTSVSDRSLDKFRPKFEAIAAKKRKPDELRLLGFAESAQEFPLKEDSEGVLVAPTTPELRGLSPGAATNIAGALELAAAWTRSDCVGRYHLFTDGIETRSDALSVIDGLRARGVRLSTTLLGEAPPTDVAVLGLEIPEGVRVGEPFKVRVSLRTTKESRGQLRLYQGSTLNGLDGARGAVVSPGEQFEIFDSVVRRPGDVTFRVEFVPEAEDAFAENNVAATSIEVPGPPRILLVDRRPDQVALLSQALAAQQLDVDVRESEAIPRTDAEFAQFHFVILSDLARADLSPGAVELLTRYVRGGGGLLYAGGEAGFGPGGWHGTTFEKILPVRMDARKEREIPGVAMALVIDRSGSMTGLPLEMAKEACNATVGVLDPHDLLEVIAFDSRPTRFVKLQPARYRDRIIGAVSQIQPGGGTEIFASLDMAYQDLAAVEARRKHIVLLTDGNASSDGIHELASAAFAEGITVTTVGLGGGADMSLLTMIAEAGGGRFHPAEDPSKLPRIFTRETELISQKAVLDDWFPVQVVHEAQFLKGIGIGAAPLLRGYTSTQLAPAPAELILQSDRGEPILARRPLGLGWTLAWTSDLKPRWATDWLRWAQFGRFLAQLVREHQKTDDTEIRPMKVEVVGDEAVATLEAYDEREGFDSSLESALSVRLIGGSDKSPKGEAVEPIPFRRVAPGFYQARAPLVDFGSYAVKAVHRSRGKDGSLRPAGVSFASVSRPYPEEFRDLESRPETLKKWAEYGGGDFDPSAELIWDAKGDTVKFAEGRQNDFIFLALVLFLLDLLVRRVRLFDRHFSRGEARGRLAAMFRAP